MRRWQGGASIVPASREQVAKLGEQALQGKGGPAAYLIAWQAATLGYLFGRFQDAPTGYQISKETLKSGTCFNKLTDYLKAAR